MGRKTSAPQAAEYAPGELEKMQASIAKADSDYFAKTYDPLLTEMRDKAAREDVGATFRGRAQADTMQGLTGNLDLSTVSRNISQGADLATGAVSNMLAGTTQALGAKREEQAGVLAAARGQEAATGTALGRAARIQSSEALNAMRNKQAIRRSRRAALMDVGMAAGGQAVANVGDTGKWYKKAGDWTYDPKNQLLKRPIYNPFRIGEDPFRGSETSKEALARMT